MSNSMFRRFICSQKAWIVCVLIACCFLTSNASVIGIDLGDQFFKATLVKPGFPFAIVENTASQRKTPTAIAFTNEQRVYGLDAIMQSSSNPQKTFAYIRDMLGMEYNDKNLEILRKQFYNFNDLVADERGYVAFKVDLQTAGETKSYVFTVEEILSMILAHIKFLAEKQSKGSVKDVYLTVPTAFGMNQRRMLNDAVELAGLRCIGMTEENVASSIAYGVDRKDENQTHTALFLNLGSSDFEVTVANYYAQYENKTDKNGNVRIGDLVENIDILSQVSDNRVSGRLFDFELLNILSEFFNSLKKRVGKPDIRENPRIVNRLLKEISKIKDTLSANKEMIVNIPEVADYENLKMTIQRTDFEQKIDKYMIYLENAIKAALEKAKVQIDQLSTVEIIGGALRVPKVKDLFSGIFGEQLIGSHINGDESMTFGAAFIGANISSSFKVRKLFLHKIVDEPIYLNVTSLNGTDDEGYIIEGVLTESEVNSRKKFYISKLDDLKIDFYTKTKGIIHTVIVTGTNDILESFEYKNNGTNPSIILEVSLSPNGFIEVNSVNAKFEYTKMELQEQKILVNNTKEESVDNSTDTTNRTHTESDSKETNDTSSDDSQSQDIKTENTTKSQNETDNENSQNKTDKFSKPKNSEPVYNIVYNTVPVPKLAKKQMKYTEIYVGLKPLNTEQKIKASEHLAELDSRDKVIVDTQKAKNEFEALIYSSREFASNTDNHVYSTSTAIEEFLSILEKDENWLYEEGYNEKLEVYKDKINEINSTISAIKFRQSEHHLREELIPPTQAFLKNFTNEISAFTKQFPWIEDYKIRKVKEIAANATEWFENAIKEQDKLALNEDPYFKSDDIRDKVFSIGYIMEKLSKTPKPKDWDKKKAEKVKTGIKIENTTISNLTEAETPEFKETEEVANTTDFNSTNASSEEKSDEDYKKEDL